MAAGQGLNKMILKEGLKNLFKRLRNIEEEEEAYEAYAEELSTLIDTYIKSGKVITVGSATTQTGAIT